MSFEYIFTLNGISVVSNRKKIEQRITLIEGRFGSTVGVPTAKSVVTNRSDSCTQIGNDRHTSFRALSGSCFQQSSHVLHTQHKDQKEWKENDRVQSDCIMPSLTSSVFVTLTTIFKMVMQSLDNRALRKRIPNVHTCLPLSQGLVPLH